MQNFFNYEYLGTLAGAMAATALIAKFLEEIPVLRRLNTRWLVLIIALAVVITVSAITGQFHVNNLPLYIINSLWITTLVTGNQHTVTVNSENYKKNA